MGQPSTIPGPAPRVEPRGDACPIRPGEPCRLCHPGSSGPSSCGLVYLVMSDPALREELERLWAEQG